MRTKIPGTEIEGAGYGDQLQGPPVISFIEKIKVLNEGGILYIKDMNES